MRKCLLRIRRHRVYTTSSSLLRVPKGYMASRWDVLPPYPSLNNVLSLVNGRTSPTPDRAESRFLLSEGSGPSLRYGRIVGIFRKTSQCHGRAVRRMLFPCPVCLGDRLTCPRGASVHYPISDKDYMRTFCPVEGYASEQLKTNVLEFPIYRLSLLSAT